MKRRRVFVLVILIILIVGTYVFLKRVRQANLLQDGSPVSRYVVCQQDIKICPDGRGVGRTGLNCEFMECPIADVSPVAETQNQFTTEDLTRNMASATPTVYKQPAKVVYGETISSVLLNGVSRKYIVYVPRSYKGVSAVPLVMSFHGGYGNMSIAAKYYNWEQKSEKEGFIIVFLNGASRRANGSLASWNAGNCCGYARDNSIDDVGFARETIKDIESKFNINKNKIYATGFSNGGMFSYRLACDMADTFKAIGAVAGTDNYDSCKPSKPISVIHIHALDDDHVLFNGGAGPGSVGGSDSGTITNYTSVSETITRWLARNNIRTPSVKVLNVTGAYCDLYSSRLNKTQVKLCVTTTGGHSWPGGQKPTANSATASTAINATDIIWDFFKTK